MKLKLIDIPELGSELRTSTLRQTRRDCSYFRFHQDILGALYNGEVVEVEDRYEEELFNYFGSNLERQIEEEYKEDIIEETEETEDKETSDSQNEEEVI